MHDSAGVRIAENPALLTFPANLKLGAKALLDVGGLHDGHPEEELNSRNGYPGAVQLSGGGLAVIDMTSVKYFDAAGKLLKVAGRDGDGPGEFRGIRAICRTRGDTIVVADRARLGVLDGHGNFVRHLPSTALSTLSGCFDDGSVLLQRMELRVPSPTTSTIHASRVPLNDTPATALGDFVIDLPDFVTFTQMSMAASGKQVVLADGSRKDLIRVESLAAGLEPLKLTTSIRSADRPVTISSAEAEKEVHGHIPSLSSGEITSMLTTRPHATTWPITDRVFADPVGNIWAPDFVHTFPSPQGFSKFDASGRLVGRLVIPAWTTRENHYQVVGFGRDNILMSKFDDDGAVHLTVYPIVPMK